LRRWVELFAKPIIVVSIDGYRLRSTHPTRLPAKHAAIRRIKDAFS
jgi:hypothetical protein